MPDKHNDASCSIGDIVFREPAAIEVRGARVHNPVSYTHLDVYKRQA